MAFVNGCWFIAGSSGTADFADGTALPGHRNLEDAGAVNGQPYSYRAQHPSDPTIWEIGRGNYSSGGDTLARTTIIASSTGSKIDFGVAPVVVLTPNALDLDLFAPKADPTFTGAVGVPDNSFTLAKLAQMAGLSVPGVGGNSTANLAALTAGTDGHVLRRAGTALGFGQIAAGAIPNSIIAFAMLASGALASFSEFNSATASKLLSNASVWADLAVLTDGATIAVDFNNGYDFGGSSNAALALGGNRTLGAPSNPRNGKKGVLWFTASGSTRTLTLNAAWNLITGVEAGPYSITTSQTLGLAYVIRGTTVYVTAILRIG